jgi:RNA polymerase sigma factor (TIGR02999 family)
MSDHSDMAKGQIRAEVTTLLGEWGNGDEHARNRLVSVVYDELRRIAAASLKNEAPGHTMQPTDLVHELYLRIFEPGPVKVVDRKHLFAIAGRQMRRILVDHARSRNAQKRGGGVLVDVSQTLEPLTKPQDLLVIDEALSKLAALDKRAAQVVELRFFAGTTEQETADALEISVNTVKRDWDFARAWLHKALDHNTDHLSKSQRVIP